MEELITSIISETIEQKENRKVIPAHCTKKELLSELKARLLINLEHMIDSGILHASETANDTYYVFN